MVGVGLDQQAGLAGHAAVGQHTVKIRRPGGEVGGHKQLATVRHVVLQNRRLGIGQVCARRVDKHGTHVRRDAAGGGQVQRGHGHTGVGQRVGKVVGQRGLAVAGQLVQLVGRRAGDLGDAGGQGVLGLEAVVGRAGGVVALQVHLVHVVVGEHVAVVAADQHNAAHRRAVILLGERRVEHGVALLPAEMAALARVAVQQAGNVRVLLPALGQIVGRHIGVQLMEQVLGGVT